MESYEKILFLTVDRKIRIATHFKQFQAALIKNANIDFIIHEIPKGYKTGKYARELMEGKFGQKNVNIQGICQDYDFILTDADFCFVYENWQNIKIPKSMIIEDSQLQGNPALQMYWASKNKFDVVFHKYKKTFLQNFGEKYNQIKFIWMPHSVDIDLFKDYKLNKKYDVLMVGWRFPEIYPYRHKSYELLKNKSYFTEIDRPGESSVGFEFENISKWPIKKDYAKLLNQSKICITGGSIHNYPVMKYFEIPASKSLLVSNWFDELGELGFIPNENMVIADYDNLDKQLQDLLKNDKWKSIAENGYKLIRKKHNTNKRVKEMLKCLRKI